MAAPELVTGLLAAQHALEVRPPIAQDDDLPVEDDPIGELGHDADLG